MIIRWTHNLIEPGRYLISRNDGQFSVVEVFDCDGIRFWKYEGEANAALMSKAEPSNFEGATVISPHQPAK